MLKSKTETSQMECVSNQSSNIALHLKKKNIERVENYYFKEFFCQLQAMSQTTTEQVHQKQDDDDYI